MEASVQEGEGGEAAKREPSTHEIWELRKSPGAAAENASERSVHRSGSHALPHHMLHYSFITLNSDKSIGKLIPAGVPKGNLSRTLLLSFLKSEEPSLLCTEIFQKP